MVITILVLVGAGAAAAERYGFQFAVSAAPRSEEYAEDRGEHVGYVPRCVLGEGGGVEVDDDEVDQVEGEGEVGDELGAGYQEDLGDSSGIKVKHKY